MDNINIIVNNILLTYLNENKIKMDLTFYTVDDILSILILLTNNINNGYMPHNIDNNIIITKNYKLNDYYHLFEYIVDTLLLIYYMFIDNINGDAKIIKFIKLLLTKLTMLNKGQILLYKIEPVLSHNQLNKYLIFNNIIIINEHIICASRHGTLMTFMYWFNKFKNIETDKIKLLLLDSITNPDDRIFKFLFGKITNYNIVYFQHNLYIKELIRNLSTSTIPSKFILKRIKLLSTKLKLYTHLEYMCNKFKDLKIIYTLHKYYYKTSYTFINLISLNNNIMTSHNYSYLEKLIDLLKTKEEKNTLFILFLLSNPSAYDFLKTFDYDKSIISKIIINNYKCLIEKYNYAILINQNINIISYIMRLLTDNNLITKYLYNSNTFIYKNSVFIYDIKLLFYTKFFIVSKYDISIECYNSLIIINNFLHRLRVITKKRFKTNIQNNYIKKYDMLKEIETFEPNNKPILKYGSMKYQLEKQKFTNLPPRHLLPGEINIYENYLLKEKVDGILINNLPFNIYPNNDIINNYQVKAEYIEELNLYLVFDIDIPNTTIIERYNILRNNHILFDNDEIKQINNLNDFMNILEEERENIKFFMNENKKHDIKWYPKFSCIVNNKNLNNELINNIILEKPICKKICYYDLYNCDGLILTPIDGFREIKIKPLSLTSIDVLYNNDMWFDRNNNNISELITIKNDNIIKKNNKIYRCYPDLNDKKFILGEFRYDKTKPNTFIIIDNIINILKYNWHNDITNNKQLYYYDNFNKNISKSFISMFKFTHNILINYINKIEPKQNKNWLDLGCGKGKLVPLCKKYNPNLYLGLDIDISVLAKCLKYHDENQDVYLFNKSDLKNDWNDITNQWVKKLPNIKYEYIIANFSLMHFFSDSFWTQLNNVVLSGSKFIFNLVSNNEWVESNSFLKIDNDKVIYKFEWAHDEVKIEDYISEDKLLLYLERYGWKVIDKCKIDSKYSLCNCYTWWIIEKI